MESLIKLVVPVPPLPELNEVLDEVVVEEVVEIVDEVVAEVEVLAVLIPLPRRVAANRRSGMETV
jgi:hypothetical protein